MDEERSRKTFCVDKKACKKYLAEYSSDRPFNILLVVISFIIRNISICIFKSLHQFSF